MHAHAPVTNKCYEAERQELQGTFITAWVLLI